MAPACPRTGNFNCRRRRSLIVVDHAPYVRLDSLTWRLGQFPHRWQADSNWHSSRLRRAHGIVANATFGRTELILLLGAALALWIATEMLFRRKKCARTNGASAGS